MSYQTMLAAKYQKPPQGRLIDTGHPLADRLRFACLHYIGSGNREFNVAPGGNKVTNTQMTVKRGSTSPRPSPFGGQGVTLDSTNGSATNITGQFFPGTASEISVSCWFYLTTAPGAQNAFLDTVSIPRLVLNVNATPALVAQSVAGTTKTSSAFTIVAGRWYHLVATCSTISGLTTLYSNGVQAVQTTAQTAGTLGTFSRVQYNTNASPTLVASIDAVCYWHRLLQPADIRQLYSDPFAMFLPAPASRWAFGVVPGLPQRPSGLVLGL